VVRVEVVRPDVRARVVGRVEGADVAAKRLQGPGIEHGGQAGLVQGEELAGPHHRRRVGWVLEVEVEGVE